MRIKHFSSTHLLRAASHGYCKRTMVERLAASDADLCVVGGDFCGDLSRSIRELAPIAETMPVVYVPGNLDYYSSEPMERTFLDAQEAAARIGNIHLLNNSSVTLGGVRFLGATLWTEIPEKLSRGPLISRINDFTYIRTLDGPWSPGRQNIEHRKTVDFLEDELSRETAGPTVVVTHNVPHESVNDPKYAGGELSPFFVTDVAWLTEGPSAPDYWIVGNNMITAVARLGRTKVLSNALGHVTRDGFENNAFDWDCVFEAGPAPGYTAAYG